jgi:hypothetical protein
MAKLNVPIPQDKIEECFVWRDWFQKLSNKVFGNMADQNSNNVSITGGNVQVDSLAVTGGKDGQLLIGRTSDHKFIPAYLTAGSGIAINLGPATINISAGSSSTTTKYYGAFADYTNQPLVSTTVAQVMTLNTTDLGSHGVSLATTSRIKVDHAGIYNFQWSGQFRCTSASLQDAYVWIRINGTDVVGSTGLISVPNKHAGDDGHIITAWNYLLNLNANDYVELVWGGSSTALSIATYAAGVSPTRPSTASLIVTLQQV